MLDEVQIGVTFCIQTFPNTYLYAKWWLIWLEVRSTDIISIYIECIKVSHFWTVLVKAYKSKYPNDAPTEWSRKKRPH